MKVTEQTSFNLWQVHDTRQERGLFVWILVVDEPLCPAFESMCNLEAAVTLEI